MLSKMEKSEMRLKKENWVVLEQEGDTDIVENWNTDHTPTEIYTWHKGVI